MASEKENNWGVFLTQCSLKSFHYQQENTLTSQREPFFGKQFLEQQF